MSLCRAHTVRPPPTAGTRPQDTPLKIQGARPRAQGGGPRGPSRAPGAQNGKIQRGLGNPKRILGWAWAVPPTVNALSSFCESESNSSHRNAPAGLTTVAAQGKSELAPERAHRALGPKGPGGGALGPGGPRGAREGPGGPGERSPEPQVALGALARPFPELEFRFLVRPGQ